MALLRASPCANARVMQQAAIDDRSRGVETGTRTAATQHRG